MGREGKACLGERTKTRRNSFGYHDQCLQATLIVIGQQGFSCGFVSSFLPACRSLGCDTRLSQSHRPPLLLSSARGRMNRRKVPVCSQASSQQQICIVGGGFGGLYTALNLAKYLDAKGKSKETSVTLISESERLLLMKSPVETRLMMIMTDSFTLPFFMSWSLASSRIGRCLLLCVLSACELCSQVAPVYTDVLKGTGVRFLHGRAQGEIRLKGWRQGRGKGRMKGWEDGKV
eukprot:767603-Hanusia_phi.AAC.1